MVRSQNSFFGLSTDVKPTSGIRAGIEFVEQDTGNSFVWTGSTWLARTYGHTGAAGFIGLTGPTGHTGPTGV